MFRTSRPIRYINQNMNKIIGSIIVILFVLLIIHFLNNSIKANKKLMGNKEYTVEEIENISNYVDEETLKDNNISNSNLKSEKIDLIIEFINYCNNEQIENAYELLSDTCKQTLFSTQEKFYNNYYKKIFDGKKTYNIQYISSDGDIKTYQVLILDDIMTSGKYDKNKVHEDHMSIVEENGVQKLNISNFIKSEDIDKKGTTNHVILTINRRYIFFDCEIYNITIFNATNDYVELDSMKMNNNTYLSDTDDNKFYINLDEVYTSDFQIYSFTSRDINIKFSKNYMEGSKITGVNFTSIKYITDTNNENLDKLYIELD